MVAAAVDAEPLEASVLGTAATAGETKGDQKVDTPPATATDARARRRESSNDDDDSDDADEDSSLRLETSLKESSSVIALNKLGRRAITMVRLGADLLIEVLHLRNCRKIPSLTRFEKGVAREWILRDTILLKPRIRSPVPLRHYEELDERRRSRSGKDTYSL
jgi:hypothetical protein